MKNGINSDIIDLFLKVIDVIDKNEVSLLELIEKHQSMKIIAV